MLVLWNGEYEEHDISEFYATKMEHMGMTLEDAIFTPTKRATT